MKYLCFLITCLSISSVAPSLESNSRDHRRIIGGDEADIKHFSYIGAILLKGRLHCGAALIRYDSVLTSAHCVHGQNITELSVRLGSSRWKSGGQEKLVEQVTIHQGYRMLSHDYSIAIVKLKGSVANAVPIPVAAPVREYLTGTPGFVFGWGMTEAGSSSETLRKVMVPVYEYSQCRYIYGDRVTERMICAGYKDGGKNACSRDLGGPYVIDGKLVGIVLFGTCLDLPAKPVVYVFVPAFYDWINHYA